MPSQIIRVTRGSQSFFISLDSGATVSFVTLTMAKNLKVNIEPNGQLAMLADEKTRMQSLGEIDTLVYHDQIILRLRALVVKHLKVDCYAGTTFHVDNKIEANITEGLVKIHGGKFIIRQSNFNQKPLAFPPSNLSVSENSTGICHKAIIPHPPPMISLSEVKPVSEANNPKCIRQSML